MIKIDKIKTHHDDDLEKRWRNCLSYDSCFLKEKAHNKPTFVDLKSGLK